MLSEWSAANAVSVASVCNVRYREETRVYQPA
jgi:hypothetical protein